MNKLKTMKHCIIIGTRPEIIKMSPIIRELQAANESFFIIHSNQHYSKEMDAVFFDELELPTSKYNLNIGSGLHGAQTAKIIQGVEDILINERPDIVYVQGDTNTVLGGAIAAVKLGIKVAHIEAGLRSFDKRMPEEINRIITDHSSDFLFPPTEKAANILINEGIDRDNIFIVGNTIVDAVLHNIDLAKQKINILSKLNLDSKKYFLLTLHRPSNVDIKDVLIEIIEGLSIMSKQFGLSIIFPIHPRTKNQIDKFNIKLPKEFIAIEPIGFLEMLQLEQNAKIIFTDSGGIQEEACILRVPCVTMRENTERPETVDVGANILAGTSKDEIIKCANLMFSINPDWVNPLGDGKSSRKIIDIVNKVL